MTDVPAGAAAEPQISFSLRIFNTVLLLFILWMFAGFAAPGVDLSAFETSTGHAPLDMAAAASISALALKFNPATTALIIYETMRLLLPGMRDWDAEKPQTNRRNSLGLVVLAILFALFQGWGLAGALEDFSTDRPLVPEPGSAFKASFALTQAGGTALLIACADTITRNGIGSGWWVMVSAMSLASLPAVALALADRFSQGLIDPLYVVALLAIAAAGGYAAFMLFNKGMETGRTAAQSAGDVILPVFLGSAVGAFLYGMGIVASGLLSGQELSPGMISWTAPGAMAVTAGLIVLFARLRCRGDRQRGWQIAALGTALFIGLQLAGANIGFPILQADIVVIVVMVGALAWRGWIASKHTAAAA